MLNIRKYLGLLRSMAIYYGKPFNRKRLRRFYRQFVPQGGLCFDLGAHLGNRTDAFLQLGARVIAVEPQPICIQFLRFWFNRHPQFTLVEQAVGARPGTLPLHISQLTPTVSTLADKTWQQTIDGDTSFKVKWEQTITVPVTTLDALIQTYGLPDFTKLDIENYELEALQGLSQPLLCLSFEYFSLAIPRACQCIDRLEQLGSYQYNWSEGESQRLKKTHWISSENMQEVLHQMKPGQPSGDIYAKLIQ